MLIAEIRRKLLDLEDIDPDSPDAVAQIRRLLSESKEDILTADVFGVLKYLPRFPYLRSVVDAIARRNPTATEFLDHVGTLVESLPEVKFRFWPTHPTPAGISKGSTEPDVELSFPSTLILVEAKLRSGFGEQQVERELAVALTQSEGRESFVLLVTPSSIPPRFSHMGKRLPFADYLNEAIKDNILPEEAATLLKANARRVLWISWDAILVAIKQAHQKHYTENDTDAVARCGDMIFDLETLLEQRGIKPFRGIGNSLAAHGTVTNKRPIIWTEVPAEARRFQFIPIPQVVDIAPLPTGWKCPRPKKAVTIRRFSIPDRCAATPLEMLRLRWKCPRPKQATKSDRFSIPDCCVSTPVEKLTPCWKILGANGNEQSRISISKVVEGRPIEFSRLKLFRTSSEQIHD